MIEKNTGTFVTNGSYFFIQKLAKIYSISEKNLNSKNYQSINILIKS